MKFTILSHAGMLIEATATTLMVDPWLTGSCYWRSWWNYPKPIASMPDRLDYVYISHMHWDHFHGPSLRRLPRSAVLLVPQAHFSRMREDAESFAFRQVVELPHGRPLTLSGGLRVISYQYGLALDSVLVADDGTTVLMDMNDCKITGWPLRQLLRRHPRVDFLFRSHSSAAAYPHCIEAEDPDELRYRSDEDYLREFADTARIVRPRYAVPFASNHCFLHRETRRYNDTLVSPLDVKRYSDRQGLGSTRCVVMVPGDSWEGVTGFALQDHDFFTARERHLDAYAAEVAEALERHYAHEDRATLQFGVFAAYFERLLRSLPLAVRFIFRPTVIFTPSGSPTAWVIDFDRRVVYETAAPPPQYAFEIRVHRAVLRDCVQKQMFATFTASKRLTVRARKGSVLTLLMFFQLLDLYEREYLPLRRCLRWRFVQAWARRWREVLHYAAMLGRVLGRPARERMSVLVPRISPGGSRRP